MVAKWTGEFEFTLDVVLEDMIRRCESFVCARSAGSADSRMDFSRSADGEDDALSLQPRETGLDRAVTATGAVDVRDWLLGAVDTAAGQRS